MRVLYHRTVKTSLVGDPVQQFLIDITADIVEGSLENFSKAVNGVGLFEFEVDDLDVELINQQRKYFGGLWGSAD